jgi:outer membrane protein OmpA-like peptidoglycan-associated protein
MEQRIRNTRTSGSAFDLPEDLRYLAAAGRVDDVPVHVSVLVAFDAGFSAVSKRPVTLLEVVESEPMETGLVTINAEAMAEGIDATGHVAVHGILFDTDSAKIKPESAPTLREVKALLEARSDLRLLVVGHTDNQGARPLDLDLSRRRAASVVLALVEQHGFDAGRFEAHGVGDLAPVATNDNAAGRARDRRVELVKQ